MSGNGLAVIDCGKIKGPLAAVEHTAAFQKFVKELGDGMSGVGFVYFVNHDLAPSTVEQALTKSRDFFELPKDVKEKYRKVDAVENFHGYSAAEDEALNKELVTGAALVDLKECFDFCGPDILDEQKYPTEVPGFKAVSDAFRASLNELSKKLLRAFAVYLKLDDPDFFIRRHKAIDDPHGIRCHTSLASMYYMPLRADAPVEPGAMRLGAHNDWGTITFLVQDSSGGLEAKHTNGTWIPVPPIPDTVVLNAGLMLEMWSGGHFPATEHRVRLLPETAQKLRQSFAYFIHPDGDSNCVPVVTEKENWTPLYPKVDKETHYEYFKERVRRSRAY